MNMNRQNNNNNNRRRRGNNRSQGNNNRNGYDHQNRVDNRARGNAAQMLEKYKKLASDAQLNGDRVNAEYYLQFADHYFRVLADFKSRQEERQGENQPRRERNDWQNDDDAEMDGVETSEGDEASESDESEREPREDRGNRQRPNYREQGRNERNDRNERRPRRHHSEEAGDESADGIDLSILPPSISTASDDEEDAPVELAERPARKPRGRRPAASANDEDVVDAAE